MRKTAGTILLLLCTAPACASAASEVDTMLQEDGSVNENYDVVDERKFMVAMMHMNAALKKRLKVDYGENAFVSVTPRGVYYKLTWDKEEDRVLMPEEVEAYREYNTYLMCHSLGQSQVFKKRNWIVRIETVNADNQRRFAQNIALKDCPDITDEDFPEDEYDRQNDEKKPPKAPSLKMPSQLI